jgi:hypothetical protein
MTAIIPEEEVVNVPHPDDMDRETFIKHVAARHKDSLPEGHDLTADEMTAYVEECWRRFHERLHRLRPGRPPLGYLHNHKAAR